MSMKNAKEFVKNHKKLIVITALTVVGGVACYALTRKKPDIQVDNIFVPVRKMDSLPDIGVGKVADLWDYGDFKEAVITDVTVEQLGQLSDGLCKLEGFTKDSVTTIVINTTN